MDKKSDYFDDLLETQLDENLIKKVKDKIILKSAIFVIIAYTFYKIAIEIFSENILSEFNIKNQIYTADDYMNVFNKNLAIIYILIVIMICATFCIIISQIVKNLNQCRIDKSDVKNFFVTIVIMQLVFSRISILSDYIKYFMALWIK